MSKLITFNILFSSTNKSALWILGGLLAALVTTGVIIQKKIKGRIADRQQKNKAFPPQNPLPEITLDDVGGLQSRNQTGNPSDTYYPKGT
ncbi:hypothetical protein RCO48_19290 [Peribacillus frigoritolerans]|nr:hypothetical protein [Peribacillus frigoritolerans]